VCQRSLRPAFRHQSLLKAQMLTLDGSMMSRENLAHPATYLLPRQICP
jgi:hypothetical protein